MKDFTKKANVLSVAKMPLLGHVLNSEPMIICFVRIALKRNIKMENHTPIPDTEHELAQFKAKYAAEVRALTDRIDILDGKLKQVKLVVEGVGGIATSSELQELRKILELPPLEYRSTWVISQTNANQKKLSE